MLPSSRLIGKTTIKKGNLIVVETMSPSDLLTIVEALIHRSVVCLLTQRISKCVNHLLLSVHR